MLTHQGLKKVSLKKDVEKYCERWEVHVTAKITQPLVDSFLLLASKAIETFVKYENVKTLHKDLKKDMANTELSHLGGVLALRVEIGFQLRPQRELVELCIFTAAPSGSIALIN